MQKLARKGRSGEDLGKIVHLSPTIIQQTLAVGLWREYSQADLLCSRFVSDASPGIGGILSCAHLKTVYPALTKLITEIHEKRGDSALSHPVKTKGKARVVVGATGRIKFAYLGRAKSLVRAMLGELESKKNAQRHRGEKLSF